MANFTHQVIGPSKTPEPEAIFLTCSKLFLAVSTCLEASSTPGDQMLLVEVGGQGAVGVRPPNTKWVSRKED